MPVNFYICIINDLNNFIISPCMLMKVEFITLHFICTQWHVAWLAWNNFLICQRNPIHSSNITVAMYIWNLVSLVKSTISENHTVKRILRAWFLHLWPYLTWYCDSSLLLKTSLCCWTSSMVKLWFCSTHLHPKSKKQRWRVMILSQGYCWLGASQMTASKNSVSATSSRITARKDVKVKLKVNCASK